jgi:hypothetical protein
MNVSQNKNCICCYILTVGIIAWLSFEHLESKLKVNILAVGFTFITQCLQETVITEDTFVLRYLNSSDHFVKFIWESKKLEVVLRLALLLLLIDHNEHVSLNSRD